MSRVLFTTKYSIESDRLSEYENIIDEIRNLFNQKEGISFSLFKVKGKENSFQEVYEYESKEIWENADEEEDERYEILMSKLADLIVPKTTEYSTLFEIE